MNTSKNNEKNKRPRHKKHPKITIDVPTGSTLTPSTSTVSPKKIPTLYGFPLFFNSNDVRIWRAF